MLQAPCRKNGKDCEKRYLGCHTSCPEYLDFKRLKEEENARIRKDKQADADVVNSSYTLKFFYKNQIRRKREKR